MLLGYLIFMETRLQALQAIDRCKGNFPYPEVLEGLVDDPSGLYRARRLEPIFRATGSLTRGDEERFSAWTSLLAVKSYLKGNYGECVWYSKSSLAWEDGI